MNGNLTQNPMTDYRISRRAALIGLATAGVAPAAFAAPALSPLAYAMKGTRTPGIAALIIRNLVAEPEVVAGVRRAGVQVPIEPGDRWHIGSDTKAMTATLIARLVERGILSWDARLDQMLPQFAALMRPEYREATLPDLMSHRAGLPANQRSKAFFDSFRADTAPLPQQRLRYLERALTDAPAGEPRGEPSYSNTGFVVAAAVAECATGRPFEALIRSEVFAPLQMNSVSFEQLGGAAEPHGHRNNRIADRPQDLIPAILNPAGGLRMSLADWASFCVDQMAGERGNGRLLRGDSYRFLHTAQGSSLGGLGWGVTDSAFGGAGPALTHAGSDGNWFALVCLFPARGSGVLVAANAGSSMGGDKAVIQVIRSIAPGLSDALSRG